MMRGRALSAVMGLLALAAVAGCTGGGDDSPGPPPRPTFTPSERAYWMLWNATVELRRLAGERVANGWTDTDSAPTSDAGRELLHLYREDAACGALYEAMDVLRAVAGETVSVADSVASRARGALADHAHRWAIAAIEARQLASDFVRVLCGGS